MAVDFGVIPTPHMDAQQPSHNQTLDDGNRVSWSSSEASSPVDEKQVHARLLELSERSSMDSRASSVDDHVALNGFLESQAAINTLPDGTPIPSEYLVPLSKKLTYLGLYFFLNVALTLSNKQLLMKISTPWLLTVSHATATSIGCLAYYATGRLKLTTLTRKEHYILVAFSSLFTLNIAVSNISLALVSVPFHQVLRATTPVTTVLLYRMVFQRSYSTQTYLAMVPLVAGVGLATIGDYSFGPLGFVLTALGVLLAATKSIATNRLMTGSLALDPLELLARMSPLAALQCGLYAYMSGELSQVSGVIGSGELSSSILVAVLANAFMAFMLNAVSFQTNKLAGALTMSICGNVKQCLTIVLGIALFDVRLTAINGLGMALAACGAAYYVSTTLSAKTIETAANGFSSCTKSKVELANRKPN